MRIDPYIVKKSALYTALVIFCLVLQTNLFVAPEIFNVKPNLILCLVIGAAAFENARFAAIFGFVCGFITDTAFGNPFMLSGILLFFCAYIGSYVSHTYFSKNVIGFAVIILPTIFLRTLFNVFFMLANWENFTMSTLLTGTLIPEFIYTAIVSPLFYYLIKFTAARLTTNE